MESGDLDALLDTLLERVSLPCEPLLSGGAPGGYAAFRAEVLRDVDLAAWGKVLDLGILDSVLESIFPERAELVPPPGRVLECLRHGEPQTLAVVLVAQSPHSSNPREAQGLVFSVPHGCPRSPALKNIQACLAQSGVSAPEAGGGDLRAWAAQGVLLLNTALTARRGESAAAHSALWRPFTDELVARLCEARRGAPLPFLLWGAAARRLAPLVRAHGHPALEWTHPSPQADRSVPEEDRFVHCPHFTEVNALLAAAQKRPVNWGAADAPVAAFAAAAEQNNRASPEGEEPASPAPDDPGSFRPCACFTDGACLANGRAGARAAFAAVLTGGAFAPTFIQGRLAPAEYAFVDGDEPLRGVAPVRGGGRVPPSNNRGELLGVIYALLALLLAGAAGSVEIVSDSLVSVRTLTEWLPARRAKGTARDLKNYDLVCIAERLLHLLRGQAASVELTHVRSHQPPPPPGAPARARLLWKGNDTADKKAEAALDLQCGEVVVTAAPPGLAALARRPAEH